MHPPLFRPHPICSELVDKLVQCHKDYEIGKFFGACNDIKSEMDKCFRMEKEEKRQANLKKAREFDMKFEKQLMQLELEEQQQQQKKK